MQDDALQCSLPCRANGGNGSLPQLGVTGERSGSVPNLVLVGTRKGGTTALSSLLLQHPQVEGPDCKKGDTAP